MKTRKRLLAWILSLVMCLSLLPSTAWAIFNGATIIKSITVEGLTVNKLGTYYLVFKETEATEKGLTKDNIVTALTNKTATLTLQNTKASCYLYNQYNEIEEVYQTAFASETRPGTTDELMTSDSGFWSVEPANDEAMKSYLTGNESTLTNKGYTVSNIEPIMKYVLTRTSNDKYYVGYFYVYWENSGTASDTESKIVAADTSALSLNTVDLGKFNVEVTTENLAGKTLTVTEVLDETGTTAKTSTGISISNTATVGDNNSATLEITTSDGLVAGTYYFKISADGAEDYIFSVAVEQVVKVNLKVTPEVAASNWTLVLRKSGATDAICSPASLKAGSHDYYFDLVQSDGTAYGYIVDHPKDGETYSDGAIYMPSSFKVTDGAGNEDNAVLKWTGFENSEALNGTKIIQTVGYMFTIPDHDITVAVDFAKAYPITLGTVTGWDAPAEYTYPWYYNIGNAKYFRAGDEVRDETAISAIQKKARNEGYKLTEVVVHKKDDPNVVTYQYAMDTSTDKYFSFTMPDYPVSVSLTYEVDTDPLIASISDQTGTIIDGIASSATFEIATKNIPDGAQLTAQECNITGAAVSAPTSGLTLEVTSVQDNAATVTVKSDGTIKAGTVRFRLLYGDTMLNTIGSDVTTIAATISDSSTKAVVIGTPIGELHAGSAGTLTFAGQVSNISDGSTVTVVETDAAGTAKTTNPTSGLTLNATTVSDKAFTIIAETTAAVPQGTYYFKATADNTDSLIIPLTVLAPVYKINSGTYQNGGITISSQSAAEGESITLTAEPNTGYILDTISVTKADGGDVTLSGTGNTWTFTMPASDVTVNATFGTAATKNLAVGTQQGELAAGTAGSATYAGTATNLSDEETLTVTETDANGTPKTETDGLSISASSVTSEQFTVTVSTTATVQAGTYYFVVSQGDSLKSGVVAITVASQTGGTTYLVNSATYQNGYVSISKQSAAEGETITLTAAPHTGYILATISVTKTDGSDVTLSGTDNTWTFTMPASDVTVNATFTSSVTTYPVKVSTVPNGTITVSPTEAAEGATVTVTVTPNSGYQMVAGSLKYSEASAGGAVVTISGNTFTMPGIEVSVSCQFEAVTTTPESPVSITSFMINGVSAAINNESRIITIVLPYGTDLSAVAPVITGVNIKSISPASAQLVNLRSAKTYTVHGTDGTKVTYTVAAYTEDPTPAMQLWENLQDHIDGTDNWWELAEYQKITGYYDNDTSGQTLYSLQTYLDDITAQYGTKRTTLNCYYYGGRLMLEPASYSMAGTSYSNILDFPRKTLSNLSDLGYSIVTYNLRELQVDIDEKMETTKGFEITVSAPSASIRSAWNKLSGNGRIFEIEASSTKAGLVLRIPVGEVLKSELSLMKYDTTKAKFVEIDRDDWYIQDGYLITTSVSAGIYGLRDR